MTVYEGMFILDSTKYSRDPDTVTGQLNDLVTEHGGTVLVSQPVSYTHLRAHETS